MRTLVHEGYLSNEPDGLVLGARFPALRPADEHGVRLAQIRRALNEIALETGATAYLSRFHDGEVHIIDVVDASCAPRLELWVGIDDSAHATALGKQILAELSPDARLDYLSRHSLDELTPHTISDRRTLLSQLDRTSGSAFDKEEYAIGFMCIAVPVRAPGVVASLAVSVPSKDPRYDADAIVHKLRSAALKLAFQLGADTSGEFTM